MKSPTHPRLHTVLPDLFKVQIAADENSNKKVVYHGPVVGSSVVLSDKSCGTNVGHADIGEGMTERVTGGGEKKIRCLTEKHILKMLAADTERKERIEDELVIEDLE